MGKKSKSLQREKSSSLKPSRNGLAKLIPVTPPRKGGVSAIIIPVLKFQANRNYLKNKAINSGST
mgnify:CR=1 FL=1